MDDAELLRYSRQIMLPELDVAGQERLRAARVLVVGLGGLGSPVALYLTAAGCGTLILSDHDHVDASNLQRQILFGEADIGRPKTVAARDRLAALDHGARLEISDGRLEGADLAAAVAGAHAVVDATDNVATRYALNRACLDAGVPLISAAAIRFEAQLSVFDPREAESPCYRCLWPDAEDAALNCAENGVIAPLVGIVGAIQAMETVKVLTGVGRPLVGRLLVLDALTMRFDDFRLRRQPGCPDCGGRSAASADAASADAASADAANADAASADAANADALTGRAAANRNVSER